jgi:hypothetical protein
MPPLRREFVERKLQLIADDLGRLSEFRDVSHEELVRDDIRLAAVERILERIVQDSNDRLFAKPPLGRDCSCVIAA